MFNHVYKQQQHLGQNCKINENMYKHIYKLKFLSGQKFIDCLQIVITAEQCSSGQYYPDPGSCTTFYICVNGIPIKQTCAPGLVWNQAQTMCDWTFNVQCTNFSSLAYEYPRKSYFRCNTSTLCFSPESSPITVLFSQYKILCILYTKL